MRRVLKQLTVNGLGPPWDAKIPSEENDGVALQPPRMVCHAVEQQGVRLGN